MSSYQDAVCMVSTGTTAGWGQVVIPTDNKAKTGLGFSSAFSKDTKKGKGVCSLQNTFHSGGFLHPIPQEVDVIDGTNSQGDLSDPEEEWKSYLNDIGYASPEEVYTPS